MKRHNQPHRKRQRRLIALDGLRRRLAVHAQALLANPKTDWTKTAKLDRMKAEIYTLEDRT